jgi:hypothetical protein
MKIPTEKNHPFWRWSLHIAWLIAAVAALKITATKFDTTEFKGILIMLLGGALAPEAVRTYITRNKENIP